MKKRGGCQKILGKNWELWKKLGGCQKVFGENWIFMEKKMYGGYNFFGIIPKEIPTGIPTGIQTGIPMGVHTGMPAGICTEIYTEIPTGMPTWIIFVSREASWETPGTQNKNLFRLFEIRIETKLFEIITFESYVLLYVVQTNIRNYVLIESLVRLS